MANQYKLDMSTKVADEIHVRRKKCGEIVEIGLVKQKRTYDSSP